jgi:hypothetical protein
MNRHLLSKSTFIRGVQCPKSLYLHKKRPFLRDKISAAQLAKFKRGTDVGVLARDLFPGGTNMTPRSPSQYQKKVMETADAMNNLEVNAIYEAVFQYDEVLIMLDILIRDGTAWKAFEVKSSMAVSSTYLTDAALQYYVLHGNGITISDFSLLYINKEYVMEKELDLSAFFMAESVLEQCSARLNEIRETVGELKEVLQLKNSPDVRVGWHCNIPYPCDFTGHCWKKVPDSHIFKLSAFDPKKINSLAENGILSADQLSESEPTNSLQRAQLHSLRNGFAAFDADRLNKGMLSLKNAAPAFIKTIFHRPAVPLLPGTRPYQPLPLAISYANSENETVLHTADNPIEFAAKIASELVALCATHAKLVTDDAADLIEFIDTSRQLLPAALYEQLVQCRSQITGLRQMLADIHYFHPVFGTNYSLQTLSGQLLKKDYKLKEEAWLIQDLLHHQKGTKDYERFKSSFRLYTSTISELIAYFSEQPDQQQ